MEENRELSNYYTVEDLDYIFIRAREKFTGNWTQLSLHDISNTDFEQWALKRFQHLIPEDVAAHFGNVWNFHDRVWLLNRMNEVLGRLCVTMERH